MATGTTNERARSRSQVSNQAHSLSERGDDLYETPDCATRALMAHIELPHVIWEPACGPGRIVRLLREAGHAVYATDLVDYNSPDQDEARWDFLMERQVPLGVQAIVTNPPYKSQSPFVAHAVRLAPMTCMLLRLAFLEGGEERRFNGRERLFALDGGYLAQVLLFRSRLPMMHRAGWEGRIANSGMAFAWFVWRHDHDGADPVVRRIDWQPFATKEELDRGRKG